MNPKPGTQPNHYGGNDGQQQIATPLNGRQVLERNRRKGQVNNPRIDAFVGIGRQCFGSPEKHSGHHAQPDEQEVDQGLADCLFQVGLQVFNVFEAHAQSDEGIFQAIALPFFFGNAAMGHGSGMGTKRFYASE